MAEWTQAQQDEFTKLYNTFEKSPNYDEYKGKANKDLFEGDMKPYDEAKSILTDYINKAQNVNESGSLEDRVANAAPKNSKPNSLQAIGYGLAAAMLLYAVGIVL